MNSDLPENLDRLAQIQHGVLSVSQARRGGFAATSVKSRLRSGRWQQLQRGVYATFTGVPSREALLWAAVLRAGPGALLSYHTAAELLRLVDLPTDPIHITIPYSRRVVAVRGVRIHIARPDVQAGHPTALPPRTRIEETVLDLTQAARNVDDACAWIARGLGRRLTTQLRLSDALAQRPHIRFRAELCEMLSDDLAGVNSALEYRYVKWV